MANFIESDYDFALSLHRELNEIGHGISIVDFLGMDEAFRPAPKFDDSVLVLSDSDTEVGTHKRRARSRSPLSGALGQVSCENQQAITIKREKTSSNDYYMPIIHTYVDLNNNQEWALVNMQSNLQQMFDKMKGQYWKNLIKDGNYNIKWDINSVISDESSFKVFESYKEVLINTEAMVRPRIQLVSVLLHILIHIYISISSKGSIRMNIHDDNFREIMLFLNKTIGTEISTSHKFIFSPDEIDYPNQWYHCTGVCQSYEPFHGSIRCITQPDKSHTFWREHEDTCGGQYFKVFQMSRQSPDTDDGEKQYVRNVRYMFPKPRSGQNPRGIRNLKTNTQVRELFDLTDESEESAKVRNLCEVIDLDSTDYNLEEPKDSSVSKITSKFVKQSSVTFQSCPFCEVVMPASQFAAHVDKCRGYQQKVVFNLKHIK